jgi:hypothetical protein
MSFWQILGRLAFSDKGETIQKVSDTNSVSSDGDHLHANGFYDRWVGWFSVHSDGQLQQRREHADGQHCHWPRRGLQ